MNIKLGHKAGSGSQRKPVTAPDSASSKSYARIVYGINDGHMVGFIDGLKSLILDNTPVQSSSGEMNITEVEVQTRWGTNDQDYLEGFPSVVNEIGYSNVEIVSDHNFVHYVNDLNTNAVGVRFTWGKIFRQNESNGDINGYRIDYAIDVQTDGNGFVEVLRTALNDKTSSGYERYHRLELPPAEVGWEIRVRRLTPNATSDFIGDKMFLSAVAEIVDAKLRYPNTALIALKFDADKFGSIPKADFRLRGKIIKVPTNYDPETRTYAVVGEGTTNGIWDGSFKLAYTNNPVWIFYDLLLSKRYGLGERLDASMVDKWALYSIGQYCDVMVPDGMGGTEPRLTCNVYINSKYEAFDLLMQLASTFRGILHWDGASIVATADRPSDPVFTFTRANIIGEFNYSGTRARDRSSMISVAFDDPANNYKTDKEVVSDTSAIAEVGVRLKELTAFGCTSRGQAQRIGRLGLLKEQQELRMVTFTVGLDGYIPVTGKIIEIADPLLAGRAIGGRISVVSADGLIITLDREVTANVGDVLVANGDDGIQQRRDITQVNGNVVTVSAAFIGVSAENVWAIDSEDLSLMRFRVLSVAQNRSDDGLITFTISGVQHNPSIDEGADFSAYIEQPTYSNIEIYTQVAPTELVIGSENVINQGLDITNVVFSWPQAVNAVKYELEWRRDNGSWIKAPIIYSNTFVIEDVYHGLYEARIVAINSMDVRSLYTLAQPTIINSKFAEPPMLSFIQATGIQFGAEISWVFPARESQNAEYVEVQISYREDKSDAKLLGNYAFPLNRAEINGLQANLKLWVKARIIDRNKVEGPWTVWVTTTTDAEASILLDALSGKLTASQLDQDLTTDIATGVAADAKADAAKLAADAAAQAAATAQTAANTAGTAAATAQTTANSAQTAASTAQTAANNAQTAATNAQTSATSAANAVAKEVTDRIAAVTAETNARTAAITKEATDRATALTAQATTLKADSTAKVAALKAEVDPKITTLQNGITQVTTDYKAADTAVVGQLNAYKTSNDSAVASVLQKAESAVSTGATNSSAITAINGQITTINGTLSTKLDASVISGYYTKGQTDAKAAEIAAGKVEEFNASLVIGGVNQLLNSEVARTSGAASNREYLMYESSAHLKQFYDDNLGKDITTSFEILVPVAGQVQVYSSNGSAHTFSLGSPWLQANTWTKVSVTTKPQKHPTTPNNSVSTLEFNGTYGTGRIPTVRKVQLEAGNKATAWSPSPRDTQAALDANSTAIQNTNAEVTRVDGVATAANNATTALAGRVSTVEGSVATKAEASALTALTTRVTNAEGVNTSQGSAITTLENSVNHATTGLASKASSSALTAVDNRVTAVDGRITTTNSNVTTLTGRVSTVESGLATKADVNALTALGTTVTAQGNDLNTKSNQITELTAGIENVNLRGQDLVSNGLGQLQSNKYWSSLTFTAMDKPAGVGSFVSSSGQQVIIGDEFIAVDPARSYKLAYYMRQTVVGVSARAYGMIAPYDVDKNQILPYHYMVQANTLTTLAVPLKKGDTTMTLTSAANWYNLSNSSSNLRSAIFWNYTDKTGYTWPVNTYSRNVWLNLYDGGAINGNVITLKTPWSGLDIPAGTQVSNGSSGGTYMYIGAVNPIIPQDWTAYSGKFEGTHTNNLLAASNRLPMMTSYIKIGFLLNRSDSGSTVASSRMAVAGVSIRDWSVAEDPTLAKATALTSTNTEVSRINGVVVAQGTSITNLQAGLTTANNNIATKADGSALTALTTRVTNAEGVNTSQGSAITTLENSVNHATTGLASKASSSALTATNSEVTRINGVVTGHATQLTQLASDITTINGNLATKADVSAVNALTTRVGNVEGGLSTQASDITTLSSKIDSRAGSASLIPDYLMANVNEWRSHYGYNLASYFVKVSDGKITNTVFRKPADVANCWNYSRTAVPNDRAYKLSMWVRRAEGSAGIVYFTCNLIGTDGVHDAAYTHVIKSVPATNEWTYVTQIWNLTGSKDTSPQLAFGFALNHATAGAIAEMQGFKVEAVISTADTDSTLATADALTTTNTEVSRVNGVVVAQGTSITNLQAGLTTLSNNVDAKADASAVDSLTTRVSTAEGNITSQGTRVTSLENSVNHATTGLSTKASSAALTTLDNKVTAIDGRVTSNSSSITSLNNSLTTTNTNVTAAQTAATNAMTAAGQKGKVIFGTTVPVAADQLSQNLWIDTTGNANTPKRWNGTAWVVVTDKVATDALAAANAASSLAATKADSSALTALDSKVTTIDGKVTTNASNITTLQGKVTTVENGLATKAEASALTALTTRVTNAEGVNTSQGSAITTLQNTVNHATTGLATKAATSALNTLDSKVTGIDGRVTANATSITNLQSGLTTANNNIATKADSSALSALTTRVSNTENSITTQSGQLTTLTNSLNTNITNTGKALAAVEVKDTRSTNELPLWYWTNHAKRIVNEFKTASVIGVTGLGTYVNLETRVYYVDASGGPILQTAIGVSNPLLQMVRSSSGSASAAVWTAWEQPLKTLNDAINTKASSSALATLDTKVTGIDGRVTANATQLTQLNSSLTTTNNNVTAAQNAADAAALLAGSKGKVLVQTAAPDVADRLVQNLWIDITGNANTPKRWNGSAWVAVTDKVATDAATAAANALSVAQTKADASALTSLTTRVDTIDGKVTAQATQVTSLSTTVGNHTASISTQQTSINGLNAKATIQVEAGNTIGGIALGNNGGNVEFIVRSNVFAVAPPVGASGSNKYMMTYRSTAITLPNGTVVSEGLYLNNLVVDYIDASKIYATSLSAISADLGTIKVGSANIADLAVTTAKIGDLQVDTLKIKDRAVTVPITLSKPAYALTTTGGGSYTYISNAWYTTTLTGLTPNGDVLIFLKGLFSATSRVTSIYDPNKFRLSIRLILSANGTDIKNLYKLSAAYNGISGAFVTNVTNEFGSSDFPIAELVKADSSGNVTITVRSEHWSNYGSYAFDRSHSDVILHALELKK